MSSRIAEAIDLLRERYGVAELEAPDGRWETLVAVVAGREDSRRLKESGGVLDSPRDTSAAAVSTLVESLKGVSRAAQKAPILKALAAWWIARSGDDRAPDWGRDVEPLREELRRIRGVSVELTDRILLFVAGFSAFPVDRSTIRIACRHGWMDMGSEYDEWQTFALGAAAEAGTDPRQLSRWMARLGRDHCGPQPKCIGCPLEPLLPAGGPYGAEES